MERMIFDREKIAEALHIADPWLYGQDADGEDVHKPWADAPESVKGYYRKSVDVVLTALGLDDLDAAVERGADALLVDLGAKPGEYATDTIYRERWGPTVRKVLEAALTATPESENTDG